MTARPLVVSLTFLLLTVSALSWLASFAILVMIPRPVERGPSLADVTRVLDGQVSPERYQLRAERKIQPPFPPPRFGLEKVVAASITRALRNRREVRLRMGGFILPSQQGSSPPSLAPALVNGSLVLIKSSFAVRNADGSWSVLHPAKRIITAWHLQILGAFALFALLLVPLAFLTAQRLAAPMRKIALWAQGTGIGHEDALPPTGGPRELQQIAAALQQMQERLRSQMEERTVMLAAVAHDLRTPLTSLRLRSETAPRKNAMVADIERMERMIQQFLHFVSGARASAEFRKVNLSEVVETIVEEASAAGLPVTCLPSSPIFVKADPVDLRRMLDNLLDNAVRYGKHAMVEVRKEADFAVVKVTDQGPGLPAGELEKVFQPFYRPDSARSAATGGSGLGLSIVRAIARAHDGDALLVNLPAGGLEAQVRIPSL